MINGLDASNVNGSQSWPALAKAHSLSFAFLKATEGRGFRDPLFPAAWKAIGALGLVRGSYHFGHPNTDATAQADAFLAYVRAAGLGPADLLALDLEVSDGRKPADVAAWGREFCAHIHQSAGRAPIVYTFISFAQEGNCAGLGGYPLWIADPSSTPGRPRIPAPWKSWALHQYGQQGLDLDVANYPGKAAMTVALGQPGTPPATEGWTSRMIADLPVLSQGADDARLPHWYVHRVQAILGAVFGKPVKVDGTYGAATAAAVASVQGEFGLAADSVVGPATWALLLAGQHA